MTTTTQVQNPRPTRLENMARIRETMLDGCHNPEVFIEWLDSLPDDLIARIAENTL